MSSRRNPWVGLPTEPPYVLPADQPYIESFNAYLRQDSPHRLRTELLPDPFTGPREAALVVLNLNPGFGGGEVDLHSRPDFKADLYREIGDNPGSRHLYLDPRWRQTDGGAWWNTAFGALQRDGHPIELLAERTLAVEFHGYHSEQWSRLPITLPSQHFGFDLVVDAIYREATIVVMRGKREWMVAVPSLRGYDRLVVATNPRQRALSPGNLGKAGYRLVNDALAQPSAPELPLPTE